MSPRHNLLHNLFGFDMHYELLQLKYFIRPRAVSMLMHYARLTAGG